MTTPVAAGYPSDNARTDGEMKQVFEDILSTIREAPGGAAVSELTIAAGVITPTAFLHSVDTESNAATDDLTNIAVTNHPAGRLVLLTTESAARVVVVKNGSGGSGQILTADGRDFTMNSTSQSILLRRVGTDWVEVSRNRLGDFLRYAKLEVGSYPVTLADDGALIRVDSTSGVATVTLPAAATVTNGFRVTIKKSVAANTVVIDPNGAETIDGASTLTLTTQYDSVTLVSDGSNWHKTNRTTAASGIFTASFVSGDISISTGGTGSVAHGLGMAPKIISVWLRNTSTEFGWAVGDYVQHFAGEAEKDTSAGNGVAAYYDNATDIKYTFGNATSVFAIQNKSTGVRQDLTNGNWVLQFRAYA